MTYLEKLKADNPAWDDAKVRNYCIDQCPKGVDSRMVVCPYGPGSLFHEAPNEIRCTMCWNHEIPGTEPINKTENNNEREETTMPTEATTTTKKTKAQLVEEIEGLKAEMDRLKKYEQYAEAANELYAMMESLMNAGFTRDEAFVMMNELAKQGMKMAAR